MKLMLLLSDDIFERWHDVMLSHHFAKLGIQIVFSGEADIVLRRASSKLRLRNEVVFSSGEELCDINVGWSAPVLVKEKGSNILACDYLFAGYWNPTEVIKYSAMNYKRFCIYTTENMASVNNYFGTLPECFNILTTAISSSKCILATSHPIVLAQANLYSIPITGSLVKEKEQWNNTMFDTAKRLLLASKNKTALLFAELCDYEKEVCRENWYNT